MRILRIHNRYQQRGGEESVFEAEYALLESHGHEVHPFEFANDDIRDHRSSLESLKLAGNTVWSLSARKRIGEVVAAFKPEVVHFDNTFPLISPAAYSVGLNAGVAVVQTLHNFRLVCPNGLFFRDGHVCEDCLGKTPPYPGVVHACYRESHAQTAVIATMLTVHRLRRTWSRDVDRYITLNEFSRQKFVEGGLPADRIVVKPHFVSLSSGALTAQRTSTFLCVGRLSVEKGIPTILQAWSEHDDLPGIEIVGDGPLLSDAQAAASDRKTLMVLGQKSRDDVLRGLHSAYALVFPSECYETFGLSIVEAFACSTPVIASNLGSMAEIVEDGITGLLFEPGNAADLAAKVRWAADHPDEMRRMGENARREYEAKYTPERNYNMLMDIYEQAIHHAKQKRR